MRHDADHYCNEPMRCPSCIRSFWKWAESWTRGRPPKVSHAEPNLLRSGCEVG